MPKEINISDKGKEKIQKPPEVKEDINITKGNLQIATTSIKKTLSNKKKIVILSSIAFVLLIGIVLFYYFGIYKVKPYKAPSDLIHFSSNYVLSSSSNFEFSELPIPKPTEPRTEVSPVSGVLFTQTEIKDLQTKRPVAVMINNHVEARPQSGLNSADIVYESLAESGITRYLAIFWSEAPAKVGPIRSVRQYHLEWLSPYDPLFIYDGCASTDNPKTNACGNVFTYNIKRIATIGAWRWNDGRRYAPHNEYSSILSAWEYAKKMKWDKFPNIKAWSFKPDDNINERGNKTKVKVTFYERLNNSGAYDTVWTYDSRTNTYLKETGGKKDIDQETNTQVYAKNVIVQEVKLTPTYDNKGRIILETIGEGKATYLIDGTITEGKWKKVSRTERTIYYDKDGKEVEFNRGRIWISVIPRSYGKFAIIEQ